MKKATRLRILGTLTVAAALALSTAPAVAAGPKTPKPLAYTCAGGEIQSGTYASITVEGMCSVAADAVIHVVGNVNVAAGAMLDAQSVPSTITVGRNVTGGAGSLVGLGCQPPSATGNSAHECIDDPDGISDITVNGNVTVTNAHTVLLNGIAVDGNVTLVGGGSEIPWAIKNNTIGRNLNVSNVTAEWVGVLFNTIGRNATLTNITVTETHPGASLAVFVVRNNVGRNLNCTGLGPNISGGFVPGSVNVVGRNANGQCAALV
jgi:hypothetical protein